MKMKFNHKTPKQPSNDGAKRHPLQIVLSFVLVFALVGGVFYAFADNSSGGLNVLGDSFKENDLSHSTADPANDTKTKTPSILGGSDGGAVVTIDNAQDLYDLSQQVAEGDDVSGITYQLTQDIELSGNPRWIPIGTQEYPFTGIFDGNGHAIKGVGRQEVPSLFGFLKNATIKDLTLYSVKSVDDSNPYAGLFVHAEESTILDCIVKATTPTYAETLIRNSGLPSDSSWRNARAGVNRIDTPAKLWDLVKEVVLNQQTYDGQLFEINVTFTEEYNKNWTGIGAFSEDLAAARPFKGTVISGTIKNFKPSNPSFNHVGLFGYTENATLENIRMENVDVTGGDHVGALVGYAKDTRIQNCSVSGTVTGINNVGGLVGTYMVGEDTIVSAYQDYTDDGLYTAPNGAPPAYDRSPINSVYSTAHVNGFNRVGGLIGNVDGEDYLYDEHILGDDLSIPTNTPLTSNLYLINRVFTTGSIDGTVAVGGVVGHLGGLVVNHPIPGEIVYPTNNARFILANAASSCNIECAGAGGGLVGTDTSQFQADLDMTALALEAPIVQSYFSGTLKGFNQIGGLIGGNEGRSIFATGARDSYVSGFVVAPDGSADLVWQVSGSASNGSASPYANVWLEPNTIYSSANPMSFSSIDNNEKKEFSNSGSISGFDHHWFGTTAPSLSGFTTHPLQYSGKYPTASSQFPELDVFVGSGDAFETFSQLSTNVNLRSLPTSLKREPSSKELSHLDGSAFTLDTLGGKVSWQINGAMTPVAIKDETLESKSNELSLNTSQQSLELSDKPNQDVQFELSYNLPELQIETKQQVTITDDTVRPFYDSAYRKFSATKEQAMAEDTSEVSVKDYRHFIEFPESITPTAPLALTLEIYDAAFQNIVDTKIIPATDTKIITDSILRFDFADGLLATSGNYLVTVPAGLLEDDNGAVNDALSLYFQAASNRAPEINFDASLPIAESTSTFEQTIALSENDTRYEGIYQGITVTDDLDYIEISDTTASTAEFVSPHKHTAAGKDGYVSQITLDNFHLVPGEYKIKYTVKDSENAVSKPYYRTYKITGAPKVTQGGEPYRLLRIAFSEKELVELYQTSQKEKRTIAEQLNLEITQRYLNTSGPEQVAAYYYTSAAERKSIAISLDTTPYIPSADKVLKGLETVATFQTADGTDHMYVLSLASLEPTQEIRLENNHYVTENTLSLYQAKRHFNAQIFDKETGLTEPGTVYYDFSNIKYSKFDIPQEITISLSPEPVIVAGMDVTVSTKATITIRNVNKWVHPEDRPDVARTFWENTTSWVRGGQDNRVYRRDMVYESGAYTPTDFFRIVANKENVHAELTFPSDLTLSFATDDVDKSKIDGMFINLNVQRVYNPFIDRDAEGLGTQQFTTEENIILPGTVTLSMPLEERLQQADTLYLYRIHPETRDYVRIRPLRASEFAEDTLTIALTEYEGEYVVTPADLTGKKAAK